MWSAYMKEFREYNKRAIDMWKEHTISTLFFVSRDTFSQCCYLRNSARKAVGVSATGVVAIFLESPKNLTAGSGGHSSHTPTTSIVRLNTVWGLSLVLSLTFILLAILILLVILIQQWACRFIQLPLFPRLSSEYWQASVCMDAAVEAVPMLLHLSVLLLLIGLVMFSFILHEEVAIVVSISVGLVGMAYFTLSILPLLDHNCLYGTPVSLILWRLWHTSAFFAAFFLRWIMRQFHYLLVLCNPRDI